MTPYVITCAAWASARHYRITVPENGGPPYILNKEKIKTTPLEKLPCFLGRYQQTYPQNLVTSSVGGRGPRHMQAQSTALCAFLRGTEKIGCTFLEWKFNSGISNSKYYSYIMAILYSLAKSA